MADKKKPGTGKEGSKNTPSGRPPESAAPPTVAAEIEWHFPEGLVGRYANQVLVQFGPSECNISFFDIRPPVVLGTPEEQHEKAKAITSVRAECVARIIVAPDFVPAVIKALQDTWTQRTASKGADQGETAGGGSE